MPIYPLEIDAVSEWLNQFGTADKYIAIRLLRTLKYVSFDDFEKFLQETFTKRVIINIRDKRPIAVFPVARSNAHKFNSDKEPKPTNDSAGRIAHAMLNLERQYGLSIQVNPRIKSMIDSKVTNIVFVDDIISTGKRFRDFWKESVSASIKSLVSKGHCKVWIIAYAAHLKGIKNILHNISSIKEENILRNHLIPNSPLLENELIKELLVKYGARTNKKEASLGYGKLASPIIFQHGCPNNAPAILWASGNNTPKDVITATTKGRWKALFPERGVPSDLYPLFEEELRIKDLPELLWSSGQYRLALSFLDKIEYPKKSPETYFTLTILGLLNTGKSLATIKNVLMLTDKQLVDAIDVLQEFQLCNREHKVTHFGKDVLERNKKIPIQKTVVDNYQLFYPSSFMGARREV